MATHSRILARRIPRDRGTWWATVPGLQRVGHDGATKHSTASSEEYCSGHFVNYLSTGICWCPQKGFNAGHCPTGDGGSEMQTEEEEATSN